MKNFSKLIMGSLLAMAAACGDDPQNYGNQYQVFGGACSGQVPPNAPYVQTVQGFDIGGPVLTMTMFGDGSGNVQIFAEIQVPNVGVIYPGANGSFADCLVGQGQLEMNTAYSRINFTLQGQRSQIGPGGIDPAVISNNAILGTMMLQIGGMNGPTELSFTYR